MVCLPEAKPVRARMPLLLCCRSESLKQAPVPTDRRGRLENQPSRARPRLRPPLLAASQDTRRSQSPLADLPLPRGEERRRDGRHPEAARRGEPTPRLATGLWGRAGLGRRVHPPRGCPSVAETPTASHAGAAAASFSSSATAPVPELRRAPSCHRNARSWR